MLLFCLLKCGSVFLCTVRVPLCIPHGMYGMVLLSPTTVLVTAVVRSLMINGIQG